MPVEDPLGQAADDAQSLGVETSCSTSSSTSSSSARRTKPSTSSGVYVLPPPITAICMATDPPTGILLDHPLLPVMAMPSMNTFCAIRNSSSTGSRNISDAAICSW